MVSLFAGLKMWMSLPPSLSLCRVLWSPAIVFFLYSIFVLLINCSHFTVCLLLCLTRAELQIGANDRRSGRFGGWHSRRTFCWSLQVMLQGIHSFHSVFKLVNETKMSLTSKIFDLLDLYRWSTEIVSLSYFSPLPIYSLTLKAQCLI